MQFKVPQYIEVEDKIIGPLTFKQAIYVGGGAGVSFVLFKLLPFVIAIPLIGGVAALAWALAFYPKQKLGKPFIEILEAGFKYKTRDKLYTWKKTEPKRTAKAQEPDLGRAPLLSVPSVSSGGLKDKAANLDVGLGDGGQEPPESKAGGIPLAQ